jgi:hypothetical protein
MLGSITPLGERSRGMRFGVTAPAFAIGSAAGGALLGGVLGAAGQRPAHALGTAWVAGLLAAAAAAGLAADTRLGRLRLPSIRRQVDERWLRTYRGWVYGAGFGFQLGAGLVTIVSSSAVYLTFLAAGLSGGPRAGALIGLVFGAMRAWTLVPAARVRTPASVMQADAFLRRWRMPAERAAAVATGAVALTAALLAVL